MPYAALWILIDQYWSTTDESACTFSSQVKMPMWAWTKLPAWRYHPLNKTQEVWRSFYLRPSYPRNWLESHHGAVLSWSKPEFSWTASNCPGCDGLIYLLVFLLSASARLSRWGRPQRADWQASSDHSARFHHWIHDFLTASLQLSLFSCNSAILLYTRHESTPDEGTFAVSRCCLRTCSARSVGRQTTEGEGSVSALSGGFLQSQQ